MPPEGRRRPSNLSNPRTTRLKDADGYKTDLMPQFTTTSPLTSHVSRKHGLNYNGAGPNPELSIVPEKHVFFNYLGVSRCKTLTRYPGFAKRFLTSSAIKTERCCPPVQPKPIVR